MTTTSLFSALGRSWTLSRRSACLGATAVMCASLAAVSPAAAQLKELRIDWATYNPVSIVLKNQGLLEKEFEKDGIKVVWVQSAGSNKALEFLNAGSIDLGSTAGAAALVARINGNPIKSIYAYSRPEWTALVTKKDSDDQVDRRPEGQAHRRHPRHRPAHLPGARAAVGRPDREGRDAGAAAACGRPPGAVARRRAGLGRAGPDDGFGRGRGGRPPVLPQHRGQYLGRAQRPRGVRQGAPGDRQARHQGLRGRPRVVDRQSGQAEGRLRRRHQAAGGRRRQADRRTHRLQELENRRRSRRTPSWPPASPCRRPA